MSQPLISASSFELHSYPHQIRISSQNGELHFPLVRYFPVVMVPMAGMDLLFLDQSSQEWNAMDGCYLWVERLEHNMAACNPAMVSSLLVHSILGWNFRHNTGNTFFSVPNNLFIFPTCLSLCYNLSYKILQWVHRVSYPEKPGNVDINPMHILKPTSLLHVIMLNTRLDFNYQQSRSPESKLLNQFPSPVAAY